MNRKLIDVLDSGESGDILKYFSQMEDILEANAGVNDNKTLTVDSSDPPCPVQQNIYTKVKITDESIAITNIDKSFITCGLRFDIVPREDFWEEVLAEEREITGDLSDYSAEAAEAENEKRKNYNFARTYRNRITKWFVGLKASIHAIEGYRVYSANMKTACEQGEALYETAIMRMLKPQEELDEKPGIYTTWKHANAGDSCVCGTYFTLEDLLKNRNGKKLTVEFEAAIPLDDFLPFNGFTLYPNKVFQNLSMEIKLGIAGNLVVCQVDPLMEFERLMKTTVGGSPGAESALLQHLRNDVPPYERHFTQMGDPFISTLYKINQNGTLENVSLTSLFTCQRGEFTSVRSIINGFNVKSSILNKLVMKYSEKPLIIPAQCCDYHAFSQAPQGTALKCNTTYGMTNVSSLMFIFPRTENQITCASNPHCSSLQISVDSKPFPDKTFSSLEPAHTCYNLANAGLDSLFSPSEEYAYSLVYDELQETSSVTFKGVSTVDGKEDVKDTVAETTLRIRAPYQDNTSYVFVVATERLGGFGNYCDGLTKDNGHITLTAALKGGSEFNPYYTNPIKHSPACSVDILHNTKAPVLLVCQDAFWMLRAGEPAVYVCNDRHFYNDVTETVPEQQPSYTEQARESRSASRASSRAVSRTRWQQ